LRPFATSETPLAFISTGAIQREWLAVRFIQQSKKTVRCLSDVHRRWTIA
jgi:hypothetical protein